MKNTILLFCLTLTFLSAGQTIGIQANYNFTLNKNGNGWYDYSHQYAPNASTVGVYFDAPIYKNLHYNVGANYMYVNQTFEPTFGDIIPIAAYYWDFYSFSVRRDIVEMPIGLSLGLYAKDNAKVQVWAHANYAYGQMVMHKYTYSGFGGYGEDLVTDEKVTKNDYTNSFKAELECRFRVAAKYTASIFGSFRYIKFHTSPQDIMSSLYIGTGVRFGFVLPKHLKKA